MKRRLLVAGLLAAQCLGLWSCAGCNGGDRNDVPSPDSRSVDLRAPPDTRSPDRLSPDTVNPNCGGSRVIQPKEVIGRGKGRPCGKGCRQVTFGASVNEFDVVGNLLVYSGGVSVARDVYLVDLRQGKEWLIHEVPKEPSVI